MRIIVAGDRIIQLGKVGENNDLQVRFPIEDWLLRFGKTGSFQLVHRRFNDEQPYPVPIVQDDEYVYWTVRNTDRAKVGYGVCELIYYIGDDIAKSVTWATCTVDSPSGSPGTEPEPYQSWLDTLLQSASQTGEHARVAKESADLAVSSAAIAVEAADSAKEDAESAKKSEENAAKSAQAAQAVATSNSFVTFDVDDAGNLVINSAERLGTTTFSLNTDGELEVEI